MTDWQPIETVPKDGTTVILLIKNDRIKGQEFLVDVGFWSPKHRVGDYKLIDVWKSTIGFIWPDDVTHWMPLPPPPKDAP